MSVRFVVRSALRRALHMLLLALVVAALGCSAERARSARQPMVFVTPHLAELAALAGRTEDEVPYLETVRLRTRRQELETLPQDVPAVRRWMALSILGALELEQGLEADAREHLHAAVELVREMEGAAHAPKLTSTLFAAAMANMRWGETQNCVALHTSESCIFPISGTGIHRDQRGSRRAIALLSEMLAKTPDALFARWLLNVAYMTVGEYPERVPSHLLIPARAWASEQDFPRFIDIAPDLKINPTTLAGGVALDDFDGDGLVDIMRSSYDPREHVTLLRNDGKGGFEDVSEAAGLTHVLGGDSVIQGDFDNDGMLDVYVVRGADLGAGGHHPNTLLRNLGEGRFQDVTERAGMADHRFPSAAAAWADFDNDGDLDLYVASESRAADPNPSQLYRNEGDGTFKDVAQEAGVLNERLARSVCWGDFDGDGFADLYVSNGPGENRLYRNEGDGTFSDQAKQRGLHLPFNGSVSWFWDYDNDGCLDLLAAEWLEDVTPVAASCLGLPHRATRARLYRGDGKGGFKDVTDAQNLSRVAMTLGGNYGDLDHDGFQDIYFSTGMPEHHGLMPNVMYRNQMGTGFADVTVAGGFGHLQKGNAVAFADLDNDGDQDVYLQTGGRYPGDGFGDALFENPGSRFNWLGVRLQGTTSNRCAIGARLRVQVGTKGGPRSIYAHVGSGGSAGASSLRQQIGIGEATKIDVLEIFWPASGSTQVFENLLPNRWIHVVEGAAGYERQDRRGVRFGGSRR